MNDERFFELAMKVIARQSTEAERAELDLTLADSPERRAEFERIRAECRLAKEILPLVNAMTPEGPPPPECELPPPPLASSFPILHIRSEREPSVHATTAATPREFPSYARERLQTKVRQTLGGPAHSTQPERKELSWGLKLWLVGFASSTALAVLLLIPTLGRSPVPIIQIAMLDPVGATRGTPTAEIEAFKTHWRESAVESFTTSGTLSAWQDNWPNESKQPLVKIAYDRPLGEVRVLGRWKGKSFESSFPVDRDLATTLKQVESFITEQMRR